MSAHLRAPCSMRLSASHAPRIIRECSVCFALYAPLSTCSVQYLRVSCFSVLISSPDLWKVCVLYTHDLWYRVNNNSVWTSRIITRNCLLRIQTDGNIIQAPWCELDFLLGLNIFHLKGQSLENQ